MRNSKRHSIDKTKCVNTKKTIPFQFFITMKKNLFRKFLALFLTGTLLAGVGCKDYDDDIDKLNDRLDELTTPLVKLRLWSRSSVRCRQPSTT